MKNYFDLRDIDTDLLVRLTIEPIGKPQARVVINQGCVFNGMLDQPLTIEKKLPLLDQIDFAVEMQNKKYTLEYETAIIIKLDIDGITIVPGFEHLINYTNDHGINTPTHYLGFNGCWNLTIDRPFYHWLHCHTAQGWLLT